MPSRMEKYYQSNEVKRRTAKNQDLYKSIYEEAEYSNVEGISIIEKNEKIDLNKIYELLEGAKKEEIKKEYVPKEEIEPIIIEEEKNYDILDILDKAKNERIEKEEANTQFNVLNRINLSNNYKPPNIDDEELKNMIEAIENNKNDYTMDLLDDLKTIHDANMKEEKIELEELDKTIDKSFYTTGLSFSDEDFEQIKDGIKRNNNLTKVLIIILSIVILLGLGFIIFYII